jgi:hypothetical protein
MQYSIKEFKQAQLNVMALQGEPVYARLFFRKLSFVLTPFIAKLPVTPNMLTVGSVITGVPGACLFMMPGVIYYLVGVLLIVSWYFLDVLDGDLARFKGMESLKGVYLDSLGHYLVNPLIFSSFSVFLFLELKELHFLGLAFAAFLIHQYSRLAKDVYHSVRYVQIDPDANPRQIVKNGTLNPKLLDKPGRVISMLMVPARYIFDAISMSVILGILRVLMAYGLLELSLAVYILLILSATLGTGMIIVSHFNKLS